MPSPLNILSLSLIAVLAVAGLAVVAGDAGTVEPVGIVTAFAP